MCLAAKKEHTPARWNKTSIDWFIFQKRNIFKGTKWLIHFGNGRYRESDLEVIWNGQYLTHTIDAAKGHVYWSSHRSHINCGAWCKVKIWGHLFKKWENFHLKTLKSRALSFFQQALSPAVMVFFICYFMLLKAKKHKGKKKFSMNFIHLCVVPCQS